MLIKQTTRPATDDAQSRSEAPAADQFEFLVHWLKSLHPSTAVAPRTVGVTSCCRGAGASTVASQLARTAAAICQDPVLLLDLSSKRSSHGRRFGVREDLGLADAVEDPLRAPMWARPTSVHNLSLLAMDERSDETLRVAARRMNELVTSLDREFGLVVLDLPMPESNLCYTAAGLLRGVLLVMEAERTRADLAARAKQCLTYAHATVLGVILNKNPQHIPAWLDARL